MDFRHILMQLERHESRGITSVDSTFLAAVLNTSTKQASRCLSRLHSMGFLVREKDKRLCISKSGKECHKGYYYEYALSSQGRKYIQWMRETRPLRRGMYLTLMNNITSYLSDSEKGMLPYLASYVQNEMRYRGPSREAQEFGLLMAAALPALTGKLAEMSKRITLLELKRDQLEAAVKEQASQINSVVEVMVDLLTQQRQKMEKSEKLVIELAQRLMRSYQENEIISHISDAWRILNKAHEAIVLDLGELLAIRNLEGTGKLLDSITRRHSAEMSMAKEYVDKAEQALRELQHKSKTASSGVA